MVCASAGATCCTAFPLPDETRAAVQGEAAGVAHVQPEAPVLPGPPGRYATRAKLTETFERELGATRVTNASEAVAALQYLVTGAQEQFDRIVVDQDGKPLAIVGSFKGKVDETAVHPSVLISEVFRRARGRGHFTSCTTITPARCLMARQRELRHLPETLRRRHFAGNLPSPLGDNPCWGRHL
jgi:hypothetical protein